jgi:hypothetical protein
MRGERKKSDSQFTIGERIREVPMMFSIRGRSDLVSLLLGLSINWIFVTTASAADPRRNPKRAAPYQSEEVQVNYKKYLDQFRNYFGK